MNSLNSTQDRKYAERLATHSSVWWKRWLDVQAPYRWKLRKLEPGFMLEVGCGIGRNLAHVRGNGIGIDHNPDSVRIACSRGLTALTTDEFDRQYLNKSDAFDSLLFSHVLEHLKEEDTLPLIRKYLPLIRTGGKLILITPQELGYASDPTHVCFVDTDTHRRIGEALGLKRLELSSFPFPRVFGRIFKYNEFLSVWEKP